jgi:hypothetical protein
MSARRWPVVTLGLIAINVIVFLFTLPSMGEKQEQQAKTIRLHLRILAAMHPELTVPAAAEKMLTSFKDNHPKEWEYLKNDRRDVQDGWEARMRLMDDPSELQAEMDSLAGEYAQFQTTSLLQR